MRSRLEARWACFLDLKGKCEWKYEPVDLNGWIPDFTLTLPELKKPILAEVKPVFNIEDFKKSEDGKKVCRALIGDDADERKLVQEILMHPALRNNDEGVKLLRAFMASIEIFKKDNDNKKLWSSIRKLMIDLIYDNEELWLKIAKENKEIKKMNYDARFNTGLIVLGVSQKHAWIWAHGTRGDFEPLPFEGPWHESLWRQAGNKTQWRAPT